MKAALRILPFSASVCGAVLMAPALHPVYAAGPSVRAVLLEADALSPQGHHYEGSAVWRTRQLSRGTGIALEASIQIPAKQLAVTWLLRRHSSKEAYYSYVVEVTFQPADPSTVPIGSVPGILMKQSETLKGLPLRAVATTKVTENNFLIGLSPFDADVKYSTGLLRDWEWIDVLFTYADGLRSILQIDKGPTGQRDFQEAFKNWEHPTGNMTSAQ